MRLPAPWSSRVYVAPALVAIALSAACAGGSVETRDPEIDRRAGVYEAYTRAQLARYLGDLEASIEWARVGVELAPTEAVLALTLGELLRLNGDYEEAVEVLTMAADRVADPVPLFLERATVYELSGQMAAADGSYQDALALAPDGFSAVRQYTEFAARVRSRARAIEIAQTYLLLRPDDAEGWRLLGGIQAEGGMNVEALGSYQRAAEIEARVEADFVALLRLSRELEDWPLTEELARGCFETYRQNLACRVEFIRSLDSRELADDQRRARSYDVLQALGRAIGANLGRLRHVERRLSRDLGPDRSLMFLESVAADRPRNSQLQARTAWAAYRVGDEDLACDYMSRVLEVNPMSADALNFIGYSYAERGIRLDEAESLVLRALDVRPNDGNIMDSLGWVYYRAGRFDRATQWLEQAVTDIPESAVLRDHLADAYRGLGDYPNALKQYLFARSLADEELRESIQVKIEELEAALTT